MIDDNDVDFAILAMPTDGRTPLGCVVSVVGLALVIVLAVTAHTNSEDCAKRHCDRGAPKLTAHECLCVEAAK